MYRKMDSGIYNNSRKGEEHKIVMEDMNYIIGDLINGNKEEISKRGKIIIIKKIILKSLEHVIENEQEIVEGKSIFYYIMKTIWCYTECSSL